MAFKRLPIAASVVAAASILAGSEARAALISEDVAFSATGFTVGGGGPVPVDPVTGSFTITFDPTKSYLDDTTDITSDSLNIVLGSALSFDYDTGGPFAGQLRVGGVEVGAGAVTPGSNDFFLEIENFATVPTFGQLDYTQSSSGPDSYYVSGSTGNSVTAMPVSGAPEPSAWALLLAGLFGLGAALRRQPPLVIGS